MRARFRWRPRDRPACGWGDGVTPLEYRWCVDGRSLTGAAAKRQGTRYKHAAGASPDAPLRAG